MNISQEDAKESLSTIQDIMVQTHRAVAAAYASPSLIMWGLLWTAAFIASQFYLAYAFYIFMAMGLIGSVGTTVIYRGFRRKTPIKDDSSQRFGRRIIWFWIVLIAYIIIWLFLLAPFSGLQCNAFISTACMFAYVVMGIWFGSYFMVWLGLTVTATTLISFYLFPCYYCLWMAIIGGGAILGTGLYIRLRWR